MSRFSNLNRLMKDVRNAMKQDLKDNGIFYIHDDTIIKTGYALIIGPKDTPYFGGYYFFKFDFPTNYPFQPPVATFMTFGQNIRFHPNLYKCGKVCISLLNTWEGEKWSSCQTISSILLSLCTIFTINPLYHEPGINSNNFSHMLLSDKYNEIINFSNYDIAICDVIDTTSYMHCDETHFFKLFEDTVNEHFLNNYDTFIEKIENIIDIKYASINKNKTNYINLCDKIVSTDIYAMDYKINYVRLLKKLKKCYAIVVNNKKSDDQKSDSIFEIIKK